MLREALYNECFMSLPGSEVRTCSAVEKYKSRIINVFSFSESNLELQSHGKVWCALSIAGSVGVGRRK